MKKLAIVFGLSWLLLAPLTVATELFQTPVDLANPPAEFASVTHRLQRVQVMRSQFTQQKQIKILKKPLISKGIVVFSQQQGLYWQIDSPLHSITIFTKQGIFEKKDGVVMRHTQAKTGNFGELLTAIFAGDTATLAGYFDVYFSVETDGWRIGLRPKTELLQQALRKITLQGRQHVEEVVIEELRGDVTQLQFSAINTSPHQLTEQEQNYFNF